MKTYTWEALNYLRICYVAYRLIPAALRTIFKRQWDLFYKATPFGEWQDTPQNGRDFCSQEPKRNLKKFKQYLVTIEKGNTAEWDYHCFNFAILNSQSVGSLLSPRVRKNVHQLCDVRNDVAHSRKITLTNEELQSYIGELLHAFTSLDLPTYDLKASMNQTCLPTLQTSRQETVLSNEVRNKETEIGKEEPFCMLALHPTHEIIRRSRDIDRIMKEMEKLEVESDRAVSTIYLSGNPGCGKSQLARQLGEEFYHERLDGFGMVFVGTLQAENLETLADSYIALAYRLGITEYTLSDLSRKENLIITIKSLMALTVPKVRRFPTWLLIVDNAVDLTLVNDLLPQNGSEKWGHGQVLITTQDSVRIPLNAPHTYHESLSEGMQPDEAIELLKQVSQLPDREQADKVAEVLDYQPLALAAAAYYVKLLSTSSSPIYSWAAYLEALSQGLREETEKPLATSNLAYLSTMTNAIKVAIQRAIESDEVIRQVFCFLSLCSGESLPVISAVNFVKACTVGKTEESITMRILNCSLICRLSREDGSSAYLQVPKIVYDVVRKVSFYDTESIEQCQYIATAIKIFYYLMKEEFECSSSQCCFISNLSKLASHCQVLLEHVISLGPVETILQCLNPFIASDEIFSWLCTTALACCRIDNPLCAKRFSTLASDLVSCHCETAEGQFLKAYVFSVNGKVLEQLCDFNKSLDYYQQALLIRRALYGDKHADVAESCHNLGTVYSNLGLYDQAKQFHEEALTIRKTIFGEQHVIVAAAYYNLAIVYNNLGRYSEAKESHLKALMIRKKILGEEHGDVASCYHSLGIVCSNLGQYSQAKEFHKMALLIRRKVLSDVHGDVAASFHSLGIVCSNLGQYSEGKEFHEKALFIRQRVFGNEHSDVAASYSSLGVVCCNLGQYNQALEFHEKALIIRRKIFGELHGLVAAGFHKMGIVYSNLGQYKQATASYEKALNIRRQIYGEVHADVAASYHNLGIVQSNLGQYNRAKEFHQKALFIRKSTYGEEHRDVIASLNSLGVVSNSLGEYNQSKEFHENALAISKKIFSEEHWDVATSYSNLGEVYQRTGEYNQAKELHEKALMIRKKIFGEEHRDVATSYHNLGAVYCSIGEYSQAKELYEKALVIGKKVFGEDHGTLTSIFDNLAAVDERITRERQCST